MILIAVMPREKDPFWKYVTFLKENKWRCNFCEQVHRGGVTRLKAHIAGVARFGIKGCERVDVGVKAEARDGLMTKKVMDSSYRGVSKDRIQGNVRAAPTSTSHSPNVEGLHLGVPPLIAQSHESTEQIMQEVRVVDIAHLPLDGATSYSSASPLPNSFSPNSSAHTIYPLQIPEHIITSTSEGMQKGAPAGTSSSRDDQTILPHSNKPLSRCNEECVTKTSSFPLQKSMDIDPLAIKRVDLQDLEGGANMASPSSSQALVPPQHRSFPHQCINHETKNAEQNPTVPSSLWKNPSVTCDPQALMDPNIKSSSQAPNNAPPPPIPPCGTGFRGPSSLQELDMNEGALRMSQPDKGNNFEENRALRRKLELLYSREAFIRDELAFAASLSLKKPRMEVANWLEDVEKLRNDCSIEDCLPPQQQVDILMQEVEDLMRHSRFLKGLIEVRETKVSKLFERKMVGEAFHRNTLKILEYLAGDQVRRLGIYGMGGVGKTNIMVYIHNRLLEKANYGNVLWITVSQDFNTQRLQDDIWEALGLDKLQEKDVRKRAALLCDCLIKRVKSTIILDDVWEHFDLEEVGIPVRANGFKLVLTTRSFDVCRQMHCQANIKIEPLSHIEAESLFLEELGSEVALNLETKTVVMSIVKECAGLPLAIITMARSMRGVTNVFEWEDCLEKLRESDMGQTDMEKVLMKLEFSYYRLGNHEIQQCFLSCALYPEDELIDKFELIEFFIDQGLIGLLNTREKQYNRGLTILTKLENVCLLEDHGNKIKMHDLIRDMALHIMSATSIVKVRKGLMRIPIEEYWTDALEKVSLMENDIREFPLNMSPNCPKLSTLLLTRCLLRNVVIPDSFLKNLWGLKVLNLSGCHVTELPNSISNLVNLRALLLRKCRELRFLPNLGKLRSLRKFDICGCVHLEALEGLEMLVNLRYLDLTDTGIERLPKGTLGCLLNLQYLKVKAINEDDIAKLWALETLQCHFNDVDDFNKCVRVIERKNHSYYRLEVDKKESLFQVEVGDNARVGNLGRRVYILGWGHAIVSVGGECAGIFILIPQDVKTLNATDCNGITNLSGMGPLEYLEELEIGSWENLGVLFGGQHEEVINIHDSLAAAPTPLLFQSLRVLEIYRCPKLKYLFGHGSKSNLLHLREIQIRGCEEMVGIISAVTSPPPHPLPFFPSLEEIYVKCCSKMKRAMESEWMPHFPNLRRIEVSKCEKMEEIIGGPPPYLPVEGISLKFLDVKCCDNMRKLFPHEWLLYLRNLQFIKVNRCKGMVEMISGTGQGQEESIMTPVNNTPSSFCPSSLSLPKLEWLELCDLPQLTSICEVPISCDSMKNLSVYKCPELKGIPFATAIM